MFCAKCGRQIDDDSRFCTYCGQKVDHGVDPADATTQLPGPADLTVALTSHEKDAAAADGIARDAFPSSRQMDAAFEPQTTPLPQGGFAQGSVGYDGYSDEPVPVYPIQPTQELQSIDGPLDEGGSAGPGRVYTDPISGSTRRNLVIVLIIVVALVAAAVWWFALRGPKTETPPSEPPAATQPTQEPVTEEQAPAAEQAQPAPAQQEQPQPPAAPGDYIISDSSTRYLEASDLQNLSDRDLWLARNEIYARHGRKFNNAELQSYFESKSWYTPRYTAEEFEAMESPLNEYETANADLIYEVEAQRGSSYVN